MTQETFLNYRRYRYLWLHLILLGALIFGYFWNRPVGLRYGNTWLGLGYGVLALLGILVLMAYGIRKRTYHARFTTLRGWLAVHVWLGISLLLLVPLHSGFQFGINIHTLAYALMVFTILSGMWGAYIFINYAPQVSSHRGGGTPSELLERAYSVTKDAEELVGTKSDAFARILEALDTKNLPTFWGALFRAAPREIDRSKASKLVANLAPEEEEDAKRLVSLLYSKREIISALHRETSVQGWLKVWLYTHVPVACGMLVALMLHIIFVFRYH